MKATKKIAVSCALILILSAHPVWAGTNSGWAIVDGRGSTEQKYNQIEQLKTETTLSDGTKQIMDYVNGLVFEFPKGSSFIFDRAQSYVATVLDDGTLRAEVNQIILPEADAQYDESDAVFLAETTTGGALMVDNDGLTDEKAPDELVGKLVINGWELICWQQDGRYHVKGTLGDRDNVQYLLQLASEKEITAEDIQGFLQNMRLMSNVERNAYLDSYPIADVKKVITNDSASNQLVDYANGYTFLYPDNMVIDASMSDLRTVLENDECRVEIYRQPLGTVSAASYKNYSNLFLKNGVDHLNVRKSKNTFGGMNAQIIQWNRPKLSAITNDKNYYYSVDLVRSKQMCYTIFFKSTRDISNDPNYQQVLKSFQLMKPMGEVAKGSFIEGNKQKEASNYHKWNAETQAFYDRYFALESEMTWGIFEPNAPLDFYTLDILEDKLDYQFDFLLQYQHLPSDNALADQVSVLNNAYKRGRTVELTLQTTETGEGEGNTVYDILNGQYDAFLRQYAKNIAAFGHPVLFRLCNEMNGDWCQYSAFHTSKDTELYKKMYAYIYAIFEAEGANQNTLWVWNPNEKSFPNFSWNNAMMYYPGNAMVDIVGLTGYNTGDYYKGEVWRTFDEIYRPLYADYTARFDKPMMITEFGSSSFGGDKELWVRQMFQGLKGMDRVKVAIWWSGCDWESPGVPARIYYLDETPELVETFKQLLPKKTIKK